MSDLFGDINAEDFDRNLDEVIADRDYEPVKKINNITKETFQSFNVKKVKNPENDEYELIALVSNNNYFRFKTKKLAKRYSNTQLFGSHLVTKDSTELFICETPFDAMVLRQELKVQAVSIYESTSEIIDSYNILDGKKVYYVYSNDTFDNIEDELKLSNGCKKIKLDMSAHEYLAVNGQVKLFEEYINGAKNPVNVVTANLRAMRDEGVVKQKRMGLSTGFKDVDILTRGFSVDLVAIGAGTGCGKTTFMLQLSHALQKQGIKCAHMLFEQESPNETLLSLAGHYDNINYNDVFSSAIANIDYDYEFEEITESELDITNKYSDEDRQFITDNYLNPRIDEMIENGKVEIMTNDEGNADVEDALRMIRSFVIQKGCKAIFLDHTTYLTDGVENQNNAIQVLGKGLKDIMHRHGVMIFYITHLRKSKSSDTHEEGGRVRLDDFAGGKAATQYATVVFGLERDMQNDDIEAASITKLRLLKRRGVGVEPGKSVIDLKYDFKTNKLYPANCKTPVCKAAQIPF